MRMLSFDYQTPRLIVRREVLGPFSVNTYIITDSRNNDTMIVDPGNKERIHDYIAQNALGVRKILLTHAHIDHVCGLAECIRRYPHAEILIHEEENFNLTHLPMQSSLFAFPECEQPRIPNMLRDRSDFELNDIPFKAIFTPGHCPGHLCFHFPSEDIIFTGDLIFENSVGRSDLPGSNPKDLRQSLRHIKNTVPPGCTAFPGHGRHTLMEREYRFNPYLSDI